MKPSKPEQQWYRSLQVDPLKKKTFTEDLAAQIKTRAMSPAKKQSRTKIGAAWLAIGVLSAGLFLFAAQSEWLKSWFSSEENAAIAEKSQSMIFYPTRMEQLSPMKRRLDATPVKSVSFPAKNGLHSVTIHLYEDPKNVDFVTAFLEDAGIWYQVDLVSNEGLHLVDVKLGSRNGQEIQITGPVAVDRTIKILRYNEAEANWQITDFEGHPTQEIDLDGDGIQELVSPEEHTVPPMVTVHRWNVASKMFESAQVDPVASKMYNIDREKKLTYSYLFQEKGEWFIEFGVGDELHHFLQYQNGVLKEVKLEDNRSRLMELRKQQNHMH